MIAVINSGPLIALAKLNRLDLLKKLFTKIYISIKVHNEVVSTGLRKGINDAFVAKLFIEREHTLFEIKTVKCIIPTNKVQLGLGERETITLALELKTGLVLIDEGTARAEARMKNLSVKGTLGIFCMAYKEKVISLDEIENLMEQIKSRKDIWISVELCDRVLSGLRKGTWG